MFKHDFTHTDIATNNANFDKFMRSFYCTHNGARVIELNSGAVVLTSPGICQSSQTEEDVRNEIFKPDEPEYVDIVLTYDRGAAVDYLRLTPDQYRLIEWILATYPTDLQLEKLEDLHFNKI